MIQLSKRLQAVADLTPAVECLADVGTDHGYIPIYLVEQGRCKRAIAMDIRSGPLQRAEEHIRRHQLGAYIETRLSDGLKKVKPGEIQAVVIAGMGGATIMHILEEGKNLIAPDTVFVLQPQSELEECRRYLLEHDFEVQAEDMVNDDNKYYPMMRIAKRPAGHEKQRYSRIEYKYGPILLKQKHPVLKAYLQRQLGQQAQIEKELLHHATEQVRERRLELLKQETNEILEALKQYREV